ncbi:hypothetical protein CASFOL_010769 [Castilleja foliolosa]|uniref:AT-hook motif nuclear-localized protein n=1 Tax=Castilleja foliolosa TaxID=1961234 RepID=A0ABD3DXC5_9LAMI
MDSQDSSGNQHPHSHHHHQPPPLLSQHPVLMGAPHTAHHNPFNMPYPMPNPNNSISVSTATSNAAMMHQQRPHFPFNPAAPAQKPMDQQYSDGSPSGSGGGGLFSSEQSATRKKRGRPRKYSPDNSIGLGLSPAPVSQISPGGGQGDSGGGGTHSAGTPAKRNRGRPPGSVKKQMDALGVPGVGFTPHVITVDPGEDVASKIVAFSQQGPRTVCILSANGAVSNVALRQPVSGVTLSYEGWFEIISLSGSFLMSESNGSHSRTGSLSVSLAGEDGRVLGGGVAGVLKAVSPVQVVVGSFIAEGKKQKTGLSSTPPPSSNMLTFGTPVPQPSPSSQGASSDSDEDNDSTSPPDHHGGPTGPYPNAGRPVQNLPMYANMGWGRETQ